MKVRCLCIGGLLVFASLLSAQDFDRYLLSAQEITGSARYVSMAGAFTSLGGDVSAITDNPAALGVFRRRELSFTLDEQFLFSHSSSESLQTHLIRIPQVSWVFGFGNEDRQAGLLRSNFALQYHRLRSYNRSYQATATLPLSQTDLLANLTKGLTPSSLDVGGNVWNDVSIGWLSVMGYDCGVIVPDTVGSTAGWYSVLENGENVQAATQVKETGAADQYAVSYAANISNRFYFGLSANIVSLTHNKEVLYSESFEQGGGYSYTTSVSTSGIGWNAALGFLYRPVSCFRLGASFRSPTVSYLRVDNLVRYGDITSPTNSISISRYLLPMQATAGVAFQFATKGLLSLEYDLRCRLRSALPYEHTLKIGGEYVVHSNWFLRMGYACRSSFAHTGFSVMPSQTDTRTDTEFFNPAGTHYASLGFGYRNRRWFFDCAYQYRMESMQFYAHAWQQQPNNVGISSHRLVLSFGLTR